MEAEAIQAYLESAKTKELLAAVGFPDLSLALFAGAICLIIQALFTGSCCLMVKLYFLTKPTSVWARLEVIWITFVTFVCLAFAMMQLSMGVLHHDHFTGWRYQDFFYFEIQGILGGFVYAPVLLFFLRRTYYLWDRNRAVLYTGYAIIGASFVMQMVACGATIRRPYGGYRWISNDTFAEGVPQFNEDMALFTKYALASEAMQTFATVSISVLLCWGIYRHRNGAKAFYRALLKVTLLAFEAMTQMIKLNFLALVLYIGSFVGAFGSVTDLIMRPCVTLTPAVFTWSLLSALTSKDRVRDILQADPVRHLETMAMTVPAASLEHQPFGEGEQDKNVVRSDEPTTKSAPATAEYTPSWFNIGRERGIASWGGVAQRSASTHPLSGYNVVLHADPEVPASPMSQVHSTGCLGPHEYAPGPRARPSIDARASPVTFGTFRAGVSEGSPCPQPDGVLHEGPVSPRGSGGMDIFDMLSDGPCEK